MRWWTNSRALVRSITIQQVQQVGGRSILVTWVIIRASESAIDLFRRNRRKGNGQIRRQGCSEQKQAGFSRVWYGVLKKRWTEEVVREWPYRSSGVACP